MSNPKLQADLICQCAAALNAAIAASKDVHVEFHIHQRNEPVDDTRERFYDTVVIDRVVDVQTDISEYE